MSENSLYEDERLYYAHLYADWLRVIGYPYLAVQVETEHLYPMVTYWNDDRQCSFFLAFMATEDDYDAAQRYAEAVAAEEEAAGNAPCGAIGYAL